MAKKILPGLTTTPMSDWRGKVEETKKYNITEIALFPTFLKIEQRHELYKLLEMSPVENIPHVHLRDDMEDWELDFLINRFNTKVFNLHPTRAAREFIRRNENYKDRIYVENLLAENKEYMETLEMCAGPCIDFSHWYDADHLGSPGYEKMTEIAKEYYVGCCHVSAVQETASLQYDEVCHSCHFMSELNEMDYIKEYKEFLPDLISIELENDFKTQLEIKKYLEKIIL